MGRNFSTIQTLLLTMTCSSFSFSVDLITDINLCQRGKVMTAKWLRCDGKNSRGAPAESTKSQSKLTVLCFTFSVWQKQLFKWRCIYSNSLPHPGAEGGTKAGLLRWNCPWMLKKCDSKLTNIPLDSSLPFFPVTFSFKGGTCCSATYLRLGLL